MVYKFLIKKTSDGTVENEIMRNIELAEELPKPIIRKIKKRNVYSTFIDNLWSADLPNMQLISKFSYGIRFLLFAIHIHRKYAWVISLKDEKDIAVSNAFQKIIDESNRKSNKVCLDKGSEFYSTSIKSRLQDNNICAQYITKENLLFLKDLLES